MATKGKVTPAVAYSELGPKAVPLIQAELSNRPDHWFAALEEITGENPVPSADKKNLSKAIQAWMAWGEKRAER